MLGGVVGLFVAQLMWRSNNTRTSVLISCSWQAKKLLEHKRKQERKREDRELEARKERLRKAKIECEKARKVSSEYELRKWMWRGSQGE